MPKSCFPIHCLYQGTDKFVLSAYQQTVFLSAEQVPVRVPAGASRRDL